MIYIEFDTECTIPRNGETLLRKKMLETSIDKTRWIKFKDWSQLLEILKVIDTRKVQAVGFLEVIEYKLLEKLLLDIGIHLHTDLNVVEILAHKQSVLTTPIGDFIYEKVV